MDELAPFDPVTHAGRDAILVSITNRAPSSVAYEGGEVGPVTGPVKRLIVDDIAPFLRSCLPREFVIRDERGEWRQLSDWPEGEREQRWLDAMT